MSFTYFYKVSRIWRTLLRSEIKNLRATMCLDGASTWYIDVAAYTENPLIAMIAYCYNHLVDINGILIFLYSAMITPCISHDRWRSTFHPNIKDQNTINSTKWINNDSQILPFWWHWRKPLICHAPDWAMTWVIFLTKHAHSWWPHGGICIIYGDSYKSKGCTLLSWPNNVACSCKLIITYIDPMVATYLGVLKL